MMQRYLTIAISILGSTVSFASSDEAHSPTQNHTANFERTANSIDALQHRKRDVSNRLRMLSQHQAPSSEERVEKEMLVKQLGVLKKAIKKLMKHKRQLENVRFDPVYPDLT
jgi:hypothetical protein